MFWLKIITGNSNTILNQLDETFFWLNKVACFDPFSC